MLETSSKIGLGTAQWGLTYGISNRCGQTTREEVTRILKFAKAAGIQVIDTAQAYGNAEQVLGENDLSSFKVITKISKLGDSSLAFSSLYDCLWSSFTRSLDSICSDSIHGVLVHNCDDLFSPSGMMIIEFLRKLKSEGKCFRIGVSVYNSLQIRALLDLFIPDIIQLPFNVLDQRLLHDGTLAKLKKLGIEIHARSIFLQGILLMQIEDLPIYFKPWLSTLLTWRGMCRDLDLSPQHVALNYVTSNRYIDKAIVGVASYSQLVDLTSCPCQYSDITSFNSLSLDDPEILNPAQWHLQV